jgi:hypothetical protein
LKAYILCRRNTNFFFFFDSIVMDKRENWKTTKSLHATFDAVVMVAKGTAENSRQLLLALLRGRLGCRLPLPHLTDRRRGVRRCLEGRGKQKDTGVLDTDERKKNLFREPGETDICKEERRRGLSEANRQALNWIANLTWERGGQYLEG